MFRDMDIIEQAKVDYSEFCALFDGKPFADVDKIVKQNNLSYGAANPNSCKYMRDINFKSICATVRDNGGNAFVGCMIEIYRKDGVFYGSIKV